MKKSVRGNEAYYTIAWSQLYKYDKYDAMRILPELSGVVCIMGKIKNKLDYMIFLACWRDGCRVGLKKFLDPVLSRYPDIVNKISGNDFYFKHTEVDTNPVDLQDVMFWLIRTYRPLYNDFDNFTDSQRYKNIIVNEMELSKDHVVERIPNLRI